MPVGSYWFTDAGLNYRAPGGALFRPSLTLTAGQFYDGTRISGTFTPAWSVSRHLTLSGTYGYNPVRYKERDQEFTSHLTRARIDLTFTTVTSASAFAQYNTADDVVGWNVRFRYNPSEGTDFYLVWDEALNADRFDRFPVAPLSQGRRLLVKYAKTFTLGF
ncbi:MAG TPA: hypothetical protein EYQ64_04435 [Gemmatimonadetes bacterium]|nr:hypothetical protein [Gemmatimonadota bacterium]